MIPIGSLDGELRTLVLISFLGSDQNKELSDDQPSINRAKMT